MARTRMVSKDGWTVAQAPDGKLLLTAGTRPLPGHTLLAWTAGSHRDGLALIANIRAEQAGLCVHCGADPQRHGAFEREGRAYRQCPGQAAWREVR